MLSSTGILFFLSEHSVSMVDHKAAADKQIDSMTDKVKEREVAGSGAAVENL